MNIQAEKPKIPSSILLPRLNGIESLRALAALMIIIYHTILLPNPNLLLPDYLMVIKERFGLGVPLFFVLSGFVLAYGYMDKLNDRNQILTFYIRRFFRIAPLFYFMLAVWIVVSWIKWGKLPGPLQEIVLNVLLLFGLVPGKHESIVWAGWSIGIEILFYLAFPVVVALVCNLRTGVLALAIAILVSSGFYNAASALEIGSYSYLNIVSHLPNFVAGVLGFLIWRATGFLQDKIIGGILLVITCTAIASIIYIPEVYQVLVAVKGVRLDLYAWSMIFMTLTLSLCFWPCRLLVNRLTTGLGRISFSLYLWHPLIIIFLLDIYSYFGVALGPGLLHALACITLTIVIVSFVAHYSYRFIESPGIHYGKKMLSTY